MILNLIAAIGWSLLSVRSLGFAHKVWVEEKQPRVVAVAAVILGLVTVYFSYLSVQELIA